MQYEDLMQRLGDNGSLVGGVVLGRIEGRNVELGGFDLRTGVFNLTPAGVEYMRREPSALPVVTGRRNRRGITIG